MKLILSFYATLFYIVILVITYWVHITYFKVDVVFYAAIMDALLATIFTAFLLFRINYFSEINHFEKFQLVAIWLLSGYCLAISVPTVIDRSLSFYILEKIQQRGGGIKLASMEQIFIHEYVKEHRLVDVRLTEQLQSGTIIIRDECVTLTETGVSIANFGRFFRTYLLPKQRLLMGDYTDDLTDPFRKTDLSVNYTCSK
jgi:hypothetical protein